MTILWKQDTALAPWRSDQNKQTTKWNFNLEFRWLFFAHCERNKGNEHIIKLIPSFVCIIDFYRTPKLRNKLSICCLFDAVPLFKHTKPPKDMAVSGFHTISINC